MTQRALSSYIIDVSIRGLEKGVTFWLNACGPAQSQGRGYQIEVSSRSHRMEASTSPQSSMPTKEGKFMASNRGIAYMGPGKVEVQSMDFPKLTLGNRKCEHGVILK